MIYEEEQAGRGFVFVVDEVAGLGGRQPARWAVR